MFDVLLHTGHEHPGLLWIVVPSLLSFAAGLGIGTLGLTRDATPGPSRLSDDGE